MLVITHPLGSGPALSKALENVSIAAAEITAYSTTYAPLLMATSKKVIEEFNSKNKCSFLIAESEPDFTVRGVHQQLGLRSFSSCARHPHLHAVSNTSNQELPFFINAIVSVAWDVACGIAHRTGPGREYVATMDQLFAMRSDVGFMTIGAIMRHVGDHLQRIPVSGRARLQSLMSLQRDLMRYAGGVHVDSLHSAGALRAVVDVVVVIDRIRGKPVEVLSTAVEAFSHTVDKFLFQGLVRNERRGEEAFAITRGLYRTMSAPFDIMAPCLYLFIRCRPSEKNAVISYLQNHVVAGLVRSTSDHIAWVSVFTRTL